MAQSIKHLTRVLNSDLDIRVMSSSSNTFQNKVLRKLTISPKLKNLISSQAFQYIIPQM